MIDDSDLPIISNAVKWQIAQIFATWELVKKWYVAKHSLAYNMASWFREIEVKDDYSVAFRSD